MTPVVCTGRSRPKVKYSPTFSAGKASCAATTTPAENPNSAQAIVATVNRRTISSLYPGMAWFRSAGRPGARAAVVMASPRRACRPSMTTIQLTH
jgi:hypothetical protein